jgi:hypothetical protein
MQFVIEFFSINIKFVKAVTFYVELEKGEYGCG